MLSAECRSRTGITGQLAIKRKIHTMGCRGAEVEAGVSSARGYWKRVSPWVDETKRKVNELFDYPNAVMLSLGGPTAMGRQPVARGLCAGRNVGDRAHTPRAARCKRARPHARFWCMLYQWYGGRDG